uniref:Helix-turn-helix domain-containing protein n=1 Tax=Neolamprologus brichardi TaxID=32507 RepID=A0A3Q4HRQ9_NEOBR
MKSGRLAFLDCEISISNGGHLKADVYRKPTHTDQYLRFDSHHPLEHKLGVIRMLQHRANTIPTDTAAREAEEHQEGPETLAYKNRYVRVPDGHFWIEGDHHGHSLDSNSFGPVSVGLLHGRASHIIWPPNRWQRITASLPANRGPLDAEEEED